MSVTASQLKLKQATTMPADFTTSNIGGAKTTTVISGGTVGEVHFTMGSALLGAGSKIQYSKFFYINENATDDLSDAGIWLPNALESAAGLDTWSFESTSINDDNTKKVRFLGYDLNGDPYQEEVLCDGTDLVTTTNPFDERHRAEVRNASTNALTALDGTGTLYQDVDEIGEIPAGYYSATAEIDIWLPATLNDTGTAADAATAPGGSSFSRPRILETGLDVANSGVLTATAGQGIWSRWTLAERAKPSVDVQVIVAIQGTTA